MKKITIVLDDTLYEELLSYIDKEYQKNRNVKSVSYYVRHAIMEMVEGKK